MIGYIFEVTNKKTGEKYLGKCYSVAFNKNYFGENAEEAVKKYGKSAFDVKMIMPFEDIKVLNAAYASMAKANEPAKEEVKEETPVEEKTAETKPARKKRTKAVEE